MLEFIVGESMGKISIKNKSTYSGSGEYIGRGSPLGNPFKITKLRSRRMAIDMYAIWLKEAIINNCKSVMVELDRLFQILIDNQSLTLICYCSPKLCHGKTIKQVLLNKYHIGDYLI